MTVHRVLMGPPDELSAILVPVGLLDVVRVRSEISCQGGKDGCFSVSDCEDGQSKVVSHVTNTLFDLLVGIYRVGNHRASCRGRATTARLRFLARKVIKL